MDEIIRPKPIPTWRQQGGRGSRRAPATTSYATPKQDHVAAWKPHPKGPPPAVQKNAPAKKCLSCQRFCKPPYGHCFYCYSNMTDSRKREARKLWPK